MFEKWGRFSYAHRRLIPAIIVAAILALFVGFGLQLEDRMSQEGWEDPNAASTSAAQIEEETFGRDNSGDVILLFHSPDENFDAAKQHLAQLKAEYPEQIDSVTSYFDTKNPNLVNDDHSLAFAAIGLKGDDEQTLKDFRTIQGALTDTSAPVEIAGATAVADALDNGMSHDISRAEKAALPLVGILLLVVFGSVVAACMPLIVGGLSILGSLGILSILAGFSQVNVFAQAVVTLLGLGLAIDYGLFLVSRFREELDKGRSTEEAVATTTATAGQTVVFSAAMVAVALSGLFLFPQAFLKSVAYGSISAVGLAALLSVTVLPSIFGMLGPKIDTWSVRRTSRTARTIEDTWWYKLPLWAMRHARGLTIAVCGLLIALTLPIMSITFGGINESYLPPNQETRVAQDRFNEEFPTFRTEPVKLVVENASNQQLVDVVMQVRGLNGLTEPMAPTTATKDGTTVLSAGIKDRDDYAKIVHELEQVKAPEGVNLYVGGTPAMEVESLDALFHKLPWMALYVVLATFLLMALVFGSFVLPLKAIVMTLLTLGATLGILTLMFVAGLGSGALNFTPGPLMSPILVLIIAIVYGLSTDYEVFLVSRMVEARRRGSTTDEAIAAGTAHTGGIITAAALIMIVVCGAFGFSDIVLMKYIAYGMIFALLIDATIVRMLLVPAVMRLLREDNWWAPSWLRHATTALTGGARHRGKTVPFSELKQRLEGDK
ncbi:MMPL family transporter [Corynebacterium kefirresidentii]|uniref:MMPL family transporter n=1 Tax=Corynebacterium kefirresidentii TaxID=1979527 RepID=A0ABT8Q7W1_9CORY|nr:MMPL family transporter [Corynebacterium kefirresidentii]MDN8621100.1 MMPL family transporter [Corynebacterium kefirresidentii]MDN8642340.1 MMPL family transporter [Corynebacterium kefirresidentii]